MEYTIIISRGNMPAVSIKVEADNVLDALESKMLLHPAYQALDKALITDIEADVDDTTFPVDGIGLRKLDNGEWRIAFDDYAPIVLFSETAFLTTARVLSANGDSLDQDRDDAKMLLRFAADWLYCAGFSNVASKCA